MSLPVSGWSGVGTPPSPQARWIAQQFVRGHNLRGRGKHPILETCGNVVGDMETVKMCSRATWLPTRRFSSNHHT